MGKHAVRIMLHLAEAFFKKLQFFERGNIGLEDWAQPVPTIEPSINVQESFSSI